MSNSIAIGLGVLILGGLALNAWLEADAHIFLARRFLDLVHWAAFWR